MPVKKSESAGGKWRPAPEGLVDAFEKALRAVPDAEPRKMFGYPCAFINGQMFAGLHQENMVLRLSEEQREIIGRFGAKPFEPMPGRLMREYVIVPESFLKAPEKLAEWIKKSFDYAKSLPPKAAKERSRRAKKSGKRSGEAI